MVHIHRPDPPARGRPLVRLALGLALAAASGPALATLGEPEEELARDPGAPAARAPAEGGLLPYRVHERTQGGTTIREYAGPDGVVFAVTWRGLAHPDLGPLLGRYAGEYRTAARRAQPPGGQGAGRRAVRVEGERVVVDRWGHMRDRQGRAWLPARVPAGVDVDDLR